MISKGQEKCIKDIADKFNNGKFINIDDRPITKLDLEQLGDYDTISIIHDIGFEIQIRRNYLLTTVLNIPIVFFDDKFIISDSFVGKHGYPWEESECIEYINGLLGY